MTDNSVNSAEKRMQLVKSIREEHARNQMTLRRREDILYGNHTSYSYNAPAYSPYSLSADLPEEAGEARTFSTSSFKLRFLIAIGAFVAFLVLDVNHTQILGVTTDDVYAFLTQDFTANSFDFISDLTYTLDNAPTNGTE